MLNSTIVRRIWSLAAFENLVGHSMKLAAELVPVSRLADHHRHEMLALMDRYYVGMDRDTFDADLSEKQWVIRIVDSATNALRGFSTLMLVDLDVSGRPLRVLFSGDTIVDHRYWARNPLAQTWGRFVLSLIDEDPTAELYWFLIAKGYKTYRFLPVFFHDFYPRFDRPTSSSAVELINSLGRSKFPGMFDAQAGIIRASQNGCRLRHGVADVTRHRLCDPHVRFFVHRNSGHTRGDELCCIAPLTRENFTPAAYRVIGSTNARTAVTP